ncbi:hypothetical protein QAD02_017784 [Eretmocerus hayati]|uniref:Uncharacterized protein n=1 Tax=Eretmocerus hayati TaxID=131215 RepID=A0ACC2PEU7_9HYME|nr:hypothetical protein QAD02_017784 [Eretmocerus hayati]
MRIAFLTIFTIFAHAIASDEKKIVCYFGSWAVYREGNGRISIPDIDPTLCTHLVYTFVGLTNDGQVRVIDPWGDLSPSEPGGSKDGFNLFNRLRRRSPNTKTLLAIGGWNEGSGKFSSVAGDPLKRRAFADNLLGFVRSYGFDGLDLDWEYPNQRGGIEADRDNFVLLLRELRLRFSKAGLLLTAAVGASKHLASLSYRIKDVMENLDFVSLMAYDFHGPWEAKTGLNAPLYASSWEKGDDRLLNVNASVHYWLEEGAPAHKLVLGVPFYARTFTLADPNDNKIGASISGPGKAGPYTKQDGSMGYNELCEKMSKETWRIEFDDEQRVPYAVKGNQWIGFDNPRSIREKAELVNALGLGGAMLWSIETDDFRGICGSQYVLLKTLNHELRGGEPPENGEHTDACELECTEPGFMRNPDNCAIYYLCIASAEQGYQKIPLKCPEGQVFDLLSKSCDWPVNVNCTNCK